jgi:hypothetical protein
LKVSDLGLKEVLYPHFPGGKPRETSVRITEFIQNKNVKRYRCASPEVNDERLCVFVYFTFKIKWAIFIRFIVKGTEGIILEAVG